MTYRLAYDAARVFAFAITREAKTPEMIAQKQALREEALRCLELAVKLGRDPSRLDKEPLFQSLLQEPRFKKLLTAEKAKTIVSVEIRLLDPVND